MPSYSNGDLTLNPSLHYNKSCSIFKIIELFPEISLPNALLMPLITISNIVIILDIYWIYILQNMSIEFYLILTIILADGYHENIDGN